MCYLNTFYDNVGVVVSMMLVLSCVYSFIESPKFMCNLNNCNTSKSTIMISMFPRAVSIVCMVSKLTFMYTDLSATIKYEKNIKIYEMYHPRVDVDKTDFRIFVIVMVSLCTIIVLPVNMLRFYLLYSKFRDVSMVLFFSIMYIQNASVCITELQFVAYIVSDYIKNTDRSTTTWPFWSPERSSQTDTRWYWTLKNLTALVIVRVLMTISVKKSKSASWSIVSNRLRWDIGSSVIRLVTWTIRTTYNWGCLYLFYL